MEFISSPESGLGYDSLFPKAYSRKGWCARSQLARERTPFLPIARSVAELLQMRDSYLWTATGT